MRSTSSLKNRPFDPTNYKFKSVLPGCAAVDLFCGAGGLTYGLRAAGIRVKAGIDMDAYCHYPFEKNNKSTFLHRDVATISGDEVGSLFPPEDIKILVGCAPCQDFSKYSQAKRANGSNRWELLGEFGRLVREVKPEIISMENVPEIQHHSVYEEFCILLTQMGYHFSASNVKCAAYGIPQTRERTVLLASKFGPINLIPPVFNNSKQYPTVKETIQKMEKLQVGEASSVDSLHQCSKLNDLNLQRIRKSRPGGTWREWPEKLRLNCHRKKSGESYAAVYGRMEWDKPAPTLTTQFFGYGNGRFGHPEQDRAISLREGAMLQSFPKDYCFVQPDGKVTISSVGRMIGNAVPPRLGMAVGESIRQHIAHWR